MFIAFNLIALALGYKVFTDATREKKGIRELGRAIGVFIMIVAFLASALSIVRWTKRVCPNQFKEGGFFSRLCPYRSSSGDVSKT